MSALLVEKGEMKESPLSQFWKRYWEKVYGPRQTDYAMWAFVVTFIALLIVGSYAILRARPKPMVVEKVVERTVIVEKPVEVEVPVYVATTHISPEVTVVGLTTDTAVYRSSLIMGTSYVRTWSMQ